MCGQEICTNEAVCTNYSINARLYQHPRRVDDLTEGFQVEIEMRPMQNNSKCFTS